MQVDDDFLKTSTLKDDCSSLSPSSSPTPPPLSPPLPPSLSPPPVLLCPLLSSPSSPPLLSAVHSVQLISSAAGNQVELNYTVIRGPCEVLSQHPGSTTAPGQNQHSRNGGGIPGSSQRQAASQTRWTVRSVWVRLPMGQSFNSSRHKGE